jgi:hypothetical protein
MAVSLGKRAVFLEENITFLRSWSARKDLDGSLRIKEFQYEHLKILE